MITSPSMESAFSIGRRKRPSAARGGSISGDPMRIKDGATARESTSGVYTRKSLSQIPSEWPEWPVLIVPSTYIPWCTRLSKCST